MIFFVIATIVFIVALLLLIGVIVDIAKLYEDINTLLFDNSQLHERLDNLENTFRLHGLMGIDQEKKDDDYDFLRRICKDGKFKRIIRDRIVAKDIKMSGVLVLSKEEWLARGGFYCGSIGRAAKSNLFTVRQCEKMGKPVTAEEFTGCRNFAMIKDCDVNVCLNRNGKRVRPCVPCFIEESYYKVYGD